jgi:RNA polymerase sigma-70 factor, ECF subfamily
MVRDTEPDRPVVGGWDLLARAREGDEKAWSALFAAHSTHLVRLAAMMTGSPDAARDCVQEAFVRLLHAQIRHHDGSVRTYLSTIVFRLAVKEDARQKRADGHSPDASSGDPDPLQLVLKTEEEREVAGAIRSLAQPHREVLVLRFYGDHSYEEIAAMTSVSIGTVKSRIFYAVKAVRAQLQERGAL